MLELTPINITIIVLAVVALLLIIWVVRLELKLRKLVVGKGSKTIDDSLAYLSKELDGMLVYKDKLDKYLEQIEKRVKKSLKGVRTIRFNPFPDRGGNQSFAAAFLSEDGDGVVISCLHAREKISTYAKPIRSWQSEYELSDEEKRAIKETEEN